MAAMEIDIPTTDVVTSLPPQAESIFLCSEESEVCHHACHAHKHRIHWSNTTFLENDSDVEDPGEALSSGSISNILQRRASNLSALTTELLQAAQSDFEDALADAIVENFMREVRERHEGPSAGGDETLDDGGDDEAMDSGADRGDFEVDMINRILGNCVDDDSSSDEDDDDGDDMFLSPPYVRRQFGSFCAYDSSNDAGGSAEDT